jgi:hypothetical protein
MICFSDPERNSTFVSTSQRFHEKSRLSAIKISFDRQSDRTQLNLRLAFIDFHDQMQHELIQPDHGFIFSESEYFLHQDFQRIKRSEFIQLWCDHHLSILSCHISNAIFRRDEMMTSFCSGTANGHESEDRTTDWHNSSTQPMMRCDWLWRNWSSKYSNHLTSCKTLIDREKVGIRQSIWGGVERTVLKDLSTISRTD